MLDEFLDRQDSRDSGICLKIDGGWFDFVAGLTKISVGSIRQTEGDIEIVDDLYVILYSYV